MSGINGDKSRHHRVRKQRIQARQRIREMKAAVGQSKSPKGKGSQPK